jgi:hypothetical protein
MEETGKGKRFAQLKALNKELELLEGLLQVAWYRRPLKYWFGSSGIESGLLEMKKKLSHLIEIYLQKTSAEYRKLVATNMELLQSSRAYFKATSTSFGMISSYSTRFSGNLLDNGYVHCYSVEGNNPILPMAQFSFPIRLVGKIDHWGNIELHASSTDMALFKTLPTGYEGRIGANGQIDIRVKDTETDFLTGGSMMINKLMANITGMNPWKMAQFAKNKSAIRVLIKEVQDSL